MEIPFPKHNYEQTGDFGIGDPFLFEVRIREGIDSALVCPGIKYPHKTQFYLLGTQHNVPIEITHRVTAYLAEKADILIGEITGGNIFGDFDDISIEELERNNLLCSDDWTVYLSPESQSILENKITPLTLKIWGVQANKISPMLILKQLESWGRGGECYSNHGIDAALRELFKKSRKPMLGLETGKTRVVAYGTLESLNIQADDSDYDRINVLLENIFADKSEKTPKKPCLDISSYSKFFSGDLSLQNKSKAVQYRNIEWVPAFKQHLTVHQDKIILTAVGLGHFEGTNSFLSLLEDAGFELIPILKEGHNKPRLSTFCNYLMDYKYCDLLKEAAKAVILKDYPLEEDRNYYKNQYADFIEYLEFYEDPDSMHKELTPNGLGHPAAYYDIANICRKILSYEMQSHHKFFQRSGEGIYYPDRLFSVDLNHAVALLKMRSYEAKEKSYL